MKLELLECLEAIEFWESLYTWKIMVQNNTQAVLRSHLDNEGLELQLVDLQNVLILVKPRQFTAPEKFALRVLNRR